MNSIRRKMIAFATEAARDAVGSMEPDSPCAVEVSKLENLDDTISDEVARLCNVATLGEMSKSGPLKLPEVCLHLFSEL